MEYLSDCAMSKVSRKKLNPVGLITPILHLDLLLATEQDPLIHCRPPYPRTASLACLRIGLKPNRSKPFNPSPPLELITVA
ncbi:hypothetical protein FOVSG1_007587 [Fusarium oxysporum f. sp. vasinfectum]